MLHYIAHVTYTISLRTQVNNLLWFSIAFNMNKYLFSRVLLVDDSQIDNMINKKLLSTKKIGELIDYVFSVEQAVAYINNLIIQKRSLPELIFLDIRMPVEDGFNFLSYFETLLDELKMNCHIMMLSSSMDPKDEERSRQFTCVDNYLCKPLSFETLDNLRKTYLKN